MSSPGPRYSGHDNVGATARAPLRLIEHCGGRAATARIGEVHPQVADPVRVGFETAQQAVGVRPGALVAGGDAVARDHVHVDIGEAFHDAVDDIGP